MLLNGTPTAVIRAALLIDADNFHEPDQLRAIHSQFGQHAGKGFVCHAHGDVKRLYEERLKSVWQELGARLMPCLPLNKNTTDAGLMVDALVLHFQLGVRRFGIASGDADFAPLSLQLRELGCEVTCFARKAIAFEAMAAYYDRVVRFDVIPAQPESTQTAPVKVGPLQVSPSPAPPAAQAVSKANPEAHAVPASVCQPHVAQPSVKPVAAPESNAPKSSAPPKSAVTPPVQDSEDKAAVRQILGALPKWLPQTIKQLNQLGSPLREAGIKKGNAPLHQLFRKYPSYFTVLPRSGQAKQVRLEKKP